MYLFSKIWKRTETDNLAPPPVVRRRRIYDLHQDIWDRSLEQKRKRKELKHKHKLTKHISNHEILEIYDLHQDIWDRGAEQSNKEFAREQKRLKKIDERNKYIVSLYDLHQDIWQIGMIQTRNERIVEEHPNDDINQTINIVHKPKPVSPKNIHSNKQIITAVKHP